MFIDEMKRKTKKTGKSPCTASPDPVRRAAKCAQAAEREGDEDREQDQDGESRGPDAMCTPITSPTPT